MNTKLQNNLHFSVAEKGKVFALAGNQKEALRHYKEALRMCQNLPSADIFFQHYSLCAMESLELMEAHNEVIEFCNKCLEFLDSKVPERENEILNKYKASLWERIGVQYLYLNEKQEAQEAFIKATVFFDKKRMSLTNELQNWISRGYMIAKTQLKNVLQKHNYYSVRKDSVNESIAIELPEMINPF